MKRKRARLNIPPVVVVVPPAVAAVLVSVGAAQAATVTTEVSRDGKAWEPFSWRPCECLTCRKLRGFDVVELEPMNPSDAVPRR